MLSEDTYLECMLAVMIDVIEEKKVRQYISVGVAFETTGIVSYKE